MGTDSPRSSRDARRISQAGSWHAGASAVGRATLARYNARVLDPVTAVRMPGEARIFPTIYIADSLLVGGEAADVAVPILADVAAEQGLRLAATDEPRPLRDFGLGRDSGVDVLLPRRVTLRAAGDTPAAPDAWSVLQGFRSAVGDRPELRGQVSLDHLLFAHPHVGGGPKTATGGGSNPFYGGVDEYVWPGTGGRAPVAWVGGAPHRRTALPHRRPVIAILDTGVGEHPWFPDAVITRGLSVNGETVGIDDPATAPDVTGVIDDPYQGLLDSDSGHATFIAGLIRQHCPDADLISIRIMDSDGAVPESVLLEALGALAVRQYQAQSAGDSAGPSIDLVSLSLGYYHEQPHDSSLDPKLYSPLHALGRAGVVVVASAGNDATDRPMLPAAFTPHATGYVTGFDPDCVPVLSVGAQNPNGTVGAVQQHRRLGPGLPPRCGPGQHLSGRPSTPHGSRRRGTRPKARSARRSTPTTTRGGFGTWSGTSFAAPVLAARARAGDARRGRPRRTTRRRRLCCSGPGRRARLAVAVVPVTNSDAG